MNKRDALIKMYNMEVQWYNDSVKWEGILDYQLITTMHNYCKRYEDLVFDILGCVKPDAELEMYIMGTVYGIAMSMPHEGAQSVIELVDEVIDKL